MNEAFFDWNDCLCYFAIAAVVLGIAALIRMWMQASPLIDLATGKLTQTTADATMKMVTVMCAKCGARNPPSAKSCGGCGTAIA